MYETFTESARAVLKSANQEAMRVNHAYIGADDILIGLAGAEGSLAARMIAARVDIEIFRQKLAAIPAVEGDGHTPRAKRVIEHAVEEARRLFHQEIGPEHLLL